MSFSTVVGQRFDLFEHPEHVIHVKQRSRALGFHEYHRLVLRDPDTEFKQSTRSYGRGVRRIQTLGRGDMHGLRVDAIQETSTKEGVLLSLPVRDGDFVAEVGWMGRVPLVTPV